MCEALASDVETEAGIDVTEPADAVDDSVEEIETETINADEVDRIITGLEALQDSTNSPSLKNFLEDSINDIHQWCYGEPGNELAEVAEPL